MTIKRIVLEIVYNKYFVLLIYIIIGVMANVSRMTDGLKRRQTYEEVIDYIENNNDRIKSQTARQSNSETHLN